MTRKIGDLAIPAGSYRDKNGNDKTRWENVGGLFENDSGRRFITLRRTFSPAGIALDDKGSNRENVIINLFSADKERGY